LFRQVVAGQVVAGQVVAGPFGGQIHLILQFFCGLLGFSNFILQDLVFIFELLIFFSLGANLKLHQVCPIQFFAAFQSLGFGFRGSPRRAGVVAQF
jgi:hypothetical protein